MPVWTQSLHSKTLKGWKCDRPPGRKQKRKKMSVGGRDVGEKERNEHSHLLPFCVTRNLATFPGGIHIRITQLYFYNSLMEANICIDTHTHTHNWSTSFCCIWPNGNTRFANFREHRKLTNFLDHCQLANRICKLQRVQLNAYVTFWLHLWVNKMKLVV